jgi:hypothetical protein
MPQTESLRAFSSGVSFEVAVANLGQFVLVQATATQQLAGFGWRGGPDAPADYGGLLRAFLRSQTTGTPLPVSDRFDEPTIYGSRVANLAFRFWHDVTHVRLHRGFDLQGELDVAEAQLGVLRAAGFRSGSLEYELLHADTMGQTLCGTATGGFPQDQTCFARVAVTSSLALAIRRELAGSGDQG